MRIIAPQFSIRFSSGLIETCKGLTLNDVSDVPEIEAFPIQIAPNLLYFHFTLHLRQSLLEIERPRGQKATACPVAQDLFRKASHLFLHHSIDEMKISEQYYEIEAIRRFKPSAYYDQAIQRLKDTGLTEKFSLRHWLRADQQSHLAGDAQFASIAKSSRCLLQWTWKNFVCFPEEGRLSR